MKKLLRPILAILLISSFTEIDAQIRSGYVFGLNLATMTLNINGIHPYQKIQPGIHFGGVIELPVAGNLTLQPGLLFSAKGSIYKIDSVEYSISPIFLEVPVLVQYSIGSDKIKLSLFTGPYFACAIGGYKVGSDERIHGLSFGSGEEKDLRHFDIGFDFGAGINIGGFIISAQYGMGLLNLNPESKDIMEMKNKVIGLSVSSFLEKK